MTKELKDKAFQLRYGCKYSYGDIYKELNISKGTLNYWFSKDGREKQKQRTKKYRQNSKIKYKRKIQRAGFNVKGIDVKYLIEYVLKYKSFCHICGEKIDILNEKHDLDHIYPKKSKICDPSLIPTLDNMHPTHSNCNFMKGKMEVRDFLKRVKKIYEYQNTIAYKFGKDIISINDRNLQQYKKGNFILHKSILPVKNKEKK